MRKMIAVTFLSASLLAGNTLAFAQWPQWGGPNRDFTIENTKLANSWPEAGPKQLWQRDLGEGYSSIVAEDGVLYTMYRTGTSPDEFDIALDAKTGKTIWETKRTAPVPSDMTAHPGPHSTPLLVGGHLFSVGRNAVLRCYNKNNGTVIWEHDLTSEYGAKYSQWGYSPSPIAYRSAVILPVARRRPRFDGNSAEENERIANQIDSAEGRTLMAFSQADGKLIWKSEDIGMDHTSPILAKINGFDQLIAVEPEAMFAVDPVTGKTLWRHAFEKIDGVLVTPIIINKELLLISTPENGSSLFRFGKKDVNAVPTLVWQSRKLRAVFSNPIAIDNFVIGSTGRNTSMLACLNLQTGKRLWADRSMAKSTIIRADDKLIMLDEDGQLALATVTGERITFHSKATVAQGKAYTPPTLAGTTLYIRDRQSIQALDLGT